MFHRRTEEGGLVHAFYVLPRHCNSMGIVHGGMLSTFFDGVVAGAVGRVTGGMSVTIHLSLDFLSMARAGEWVYGEGKVTRQTRDLVFVEGRIYIGEKDVLRGSGVFKPMRKKAE
jgi:uncharacterized protein (TIGR00369 family)